MISKHYTFFIFSKRPGLKSRNVIRSCQSLIYLLSMKREYSQDAFKRDNPTYYKEATF